jgi:hypothetical protein
VGEVVVERRQIRGTRRGRAVRIRVHGVGTVELLGVGKRMSWTSNASTV